jgi:hypothetical protein
MKARTMLLVALVVVAGCGSSGAHESQAQKLELERCWQAKWQRTRHPAQVKIGDLLDECREELGR